MYLLSFWFSSFRFVLDVYLFGNMFISRNNGSLLLWYPHVTAFFIGFCVLTQARGWIRIAVEL